MTRLVFQHLFRFRKRLFSPFETEFFNQLLSLLSTADSKILQSQLQEINVVHRERYHDEILFYKIENLRVTDKRLLKFDYPGEHVLCEVQILFRDNKSVGAKVWIIDGEFFSLKFSDDIIDYRKSTDFNVSLI